MFNIATCKGCAGRATLRDLEDLCSTVDEVDFFLSGCMNRCRQGPNIAVKGHIHSLQGVHSFEKIAALVGAASRDGIPQEALARSARRSKGVRLLDQARIESVKS